MRIASKGLLLTGMLALMATPLAACAQPSSTDWPTKAVSLVVPFPPGGNSDVIGRQLAQQLSEILGQPVIIENRAGASTTIGAGYVARAPKDGYTLLLSSGSTFTTTPHLMGKLPYTLDDFAPVGTVATVPFAFVVKKDLPVTNVAQFAAYAKASPGKVNNATNGQGSMVHLLGDLVASGLGVTFTHVHYKGAAPATVDMIGGIVDSNVEALSSALPNLNTGKYRALAVLSPQRLPLLPDTPTFKEAGYPDIVGETWYGVFAPAGTPSPIINKLNTALRSVITSDKFADSMRKNANEPRTSTPDELLQTTRQESDNWARLIQKLNIKAE